MWNLKTLSIRARGIAAFDGEAACQHWRRSQQFPAIQSTYPGFCLAVYSHPAASQGPTSPCYCRLSAMKTPLDRSRQGDHQQGSEARPEATYFRAGAHPPPTLTR